MLKPPGRLPLGSLIVALAGAGLLAMPLTARADSVAVGSAAGSGSSVAIGSAPEGSTVIVNGKPCRVVTGDAGAGNSTTIHTGPGGLSGTTTVTPGGSTSVTVGSGSSTGGSASAGAGSDCVITRPQEGEHR